MFIYCHIELHLFYLDVEENYNASNALINSHVQLMVYQFTLFNPIIKVFPACHVPTPSSQRHKVRKKKK